MTSGIIYQVKCHVKSDKMRHTAHTHRKKYNKRAIPFYENKWTRIIIQRTNKDRTLIKFNAEHVRPNICLWLRRRQWNEFWAFWRLSRYKSYKSRNMRYRGGNLIYCIQPDLACDWKQFIRAAENFGGLWFGLDPYQPLSPVIVTAGCWHQVQCLLGTPSLVDILQMNRETEKR